MNYTDKSKFFYCVGISGVCMFVGLFIWSGEIQCQTSIEQYGTWAGSSSGQESNQLTITLGSGNPIAIVGSGNVVEKLYAIQPFDAIVCPLGLVQVVHTKAQDVVTMQGDDNIIAAFDIFVENNTLYVQPTSDSLQLTSTRFPFIELIIGLGRKEELTVYGAGEYDLGTITGKNFTFVMQGKSAVTAANIEVDTCTIDARGNCDTIMTIKANTAAHISSAGMSIVRANIMTDSLHVQVQGTGTVILDGNAVTQQLLVDGASYYDGKNMQTKFTELTLNGASQATVHASESITGSVQGTSSVTYFGNPKTVHLLSIGMSEVHKG